MKQGQHQSSIPCGAVCIHYWHKGFLCNAPDSTQQGQRQEEGCKGGTPEERRSPVGPFGPHLPPLLRFCPGHCSGWRRACKPVWPLVWSCHAWLDARCALQVRLKFGRRCRRRCAFSEKELLNGA